MKVLVILLVAFNIAAFVLASDDFRDEPPILAETGSPPSEAGSPPPEAGSPPPEAGSPPPEAGSPPPDAGSPPPDAGSAPPAEVATTLAPTVAPIVPTVAPGECEVGWEKFEKSCYKAIHPHDNTNDGSLKTCGALSANLVSVHSKEENEFIRKVAKLENERVKKEIGKSIKGFWLGLKLQRDIDKKITGATWTDGTPLDFGNPAIQHRGIYPWSGPWSYHKDTAGDYDQPDNGRGDELCTVLYPEMPDEGWNDDQCERTDPNNIFDAICKKSVQL